MSDLSALAGLRLHYLDEGPKDARRTWLLVHGHPTWNYVFRDLIPVLLAAGDRVVAPDLIGFGKSDKPKKEAVHRLQWHAQVLQELVERLDLQNTVLVAHGMSTLLAMAVPSVAAHRFAGLVTVNGWVPGDGEPAKPLQQWQDQLARKPNLSIGGDAAWNAPYPDVGYRAAVRAFAANMLGDEDAIWAREVLDFWRTQGDHRALVIAGTDDAFVDERAARQLLQRLDGKADLLIVPRLDHFISEHGADVAKHAVEYFTPF
ncbi:Haloalkane dehalogenase [bioreactor metagenome]|uniref:Haloalkane dehalogenase n=1 Tax=bioreactor metagenome TaxID=1076179 RepID=A0A645FSM7_9ZZZZ